MSGHTIFKENRLKLAGTPLAVGDTLPDATLISTTMQPVELGSWRSSPSILFTVPSLDTPVCAIETKRFNKELQSLEFRGNVAVISCDLPFAMQRWCGLSKSRQSPL
jgi:thiol peroxidase